MSSIYEEEHFNLDKCGHSDWTPCTKEDVNLIDTISIKDRSVTLPANVKIEIDGIVLVFVMEKI